MLLQSQNRLRIRLTCVSECVYKMLNKLHLSMENYDNYELSIMSESWGFVDEMRDVLQLTCAQEWGLDILRNGVR